MQPCQYVSTIASRSVASRTHLDVDHLIPDPLVQSLQWPGCKIPVALEHRSRPRFILGRQDPGDAFDEGTARLAAQGRRGDADPRIVPDALHLAEVRLGAEVQDP